MYGDNSVVNDWSQESFENDARTVRTVEEMTDDEIALFQDVGLKDPRLEVK